MSTEKVITSSVGDPSAPYEPTPAPEDTCFACSKWLRELGVSHVIPMEMIASQVHNTANAMEVLAKIAQSINEHEKMARLILLRAEFLRIFDYQPQAANDAGTSPGTSSAADSA